MLKIFNPLWIAANVFTLWGGGGGGGSSKTTQQATIDPMLKPYVTYGLNEARSLYNRPGPAYYPGQTYVSPSGATMTAMDLATQRALSGSPLTQAATQQQQDVLSGKYLMADNPYFQQALSGGQRAATQSYNDAIRAAQGTSALAGRYGSNVSADIQNRAAQTLANTLADQSGTLSYQNYAAERARQEQAAAMAPTLSQAGYADIAQLADVGRKQEDYQQAALEDAINRYNYNVNLPQTKLNQFLSQVYGAPQGSQTTSTTSGGGKIICTAMNHVYGFGSFRQSIWLKHSANLHPAYERGYHALFLPLVMYAFDKKDGKVRKAVRKVLEHIARHRTADIWKQRKGKRDKLGMVYRAIFEPICFVAGWLKGE